MSYKPLTADNCKEFKNFKYSEFKCKCGGKYCNGYPVAFSYDLAKNLQTIRSHFGKALNITSPLRCETWNSKQGGVKNSKHKKGWAVDFYIKGVSYNTLAKYVKTLPYFNYCYRVKKNQDVIHYDITPPAYTEPKSETKTDNNEELIKSLNNQINDLNNTNSNLTNTINELNNKISTLNQELDNKQAELDTLNQKMINSTNKYKLLYKCPKNSLYKIRVNLSVNDKLLIEKNK